MAQLEHYTDVMGPNTAQTLAELRDEFTDGEPGSADDPIGTHTPLAIDQMVGHLRRLISKAENKAYETGAGLQGEIDDEVAIDIRLSYGENKKKIKSAYGVEFDTEEQARLRALDADAEGRAKRHARETLRENFDEIEAGDADELVADIEAEFGEEFVADVLETERVERASIEEYAETVKEATEPETPTEPAATEQATLDVGVTADPDPTPVTDGGTEPSDDTTGGVVATLRSFAERVGSVVTTGSSGRDPQGSDPEQPTLDRWVSEPTAQPTLESFGATPSDRSPPEPAAPATPETPGPTTEPTTLAAY